MGQLAGGPIASPHTSSRTPLQLAKQPEIKNKKFNTKYTFSLGNGEDIYYIQRDPVPLGPDLTVNSATLVQHLLDTPGKPTLHASRREYSK